MVTITPAGRTAVVTGGAGDIGRAVAMGLAETGCKTIVIDRDDDRVTRTIQLAAADGLDVSGYVADLAESANLRRLSRLITETHGPATVLVNAIGIVSSKPFLEINLTEWHRVLSVNLQAVFQTSQCFAVAMKDQGVGRIINIASAAGKTGGGLLGTAAYVTSKAGVIGFTKAIARELAGSGITCNSIAPGPIDTSMTSIYREQPELRAQVESSLPLRRIGLPHEVADVAVYLASKQAAYITGETFDVDGGLIME